jgi:hypothetical protein
MWTICRSGLESIHWASVEKNGVSGLNVAEGILRRNYGDRHEPSARDQNHLAVIGIGS